MDDKLNSHTSIETKEQPGRIRKLADKVKRRAGNTITAALMATSPMAPTATFVPASINTVTAVAPTAAKIISAWIIASLLAACWDEPDDVLEKDTTPPTINVSKSEMDITWWKEVLIQGNQLLIWNTPVASRYDNKTKNCGVALYMNWKNITSGTILSEEWTLTIKVTDDAGNVRNIDIKLNVAKNAPSITVSQYEVNVFWWVTVNIKDNQLLFWDEIIASRNDDNLQSCKVSLNFNWQEIKSWDTIKEAWKLTITITNKNSKTSTAEITVTNDAIYGLENLRNATLQVDKEINLLNWISFADGVELVKTEVEIDGKRTAVDPNHYTPSYPWTVNVIFTIQKNWKSTEIKVDNLTIHSLNYQEPSINTADMINNKYSRYNSLPQARRDFIYPHLLASYAAANRSKQDNKVHIIMWESANVDDIENIWNIWGSNHGNEGYRRIKALSLDTPIKACMHWSEIENYINEHPNNNYMISLAADHLWWSTWQELDKASETASLRRILEKENVIVVNSIADKTVNYRKLYNENIKNGDKYRSASINSNKKNKISVSWYKISGYNNYYAQNDEASLATSLPVWFEKDKWNIVMPMTSLFVWDNDTYSSYPTAVVSAVVWNAISVVMANHPWTTPEDAMTIIVDNYLIEKKFQYKDESGDLVDGWERYFIDMDKLLESELLQSKKIDNIKLNADLISLPSGNGICYMGKWIQFEYNWKKYNATTENQTILNQALKSWNIKRYRHRDTFKKFWWTNSAQFDVYVVDKSWNKFPNLHKSITKTVN